MKLALDMREQSATDGAEQWPMCWQCVLYYCARERTAPLHLVLQARLVCRWAWTEELASIGCARLASGGGDSREDDRATFDQLYRHAYHFVANLESGGALRIKQYQRYDLAGRVTRFADWVERQPAPFNARSRSADFDCMVLEFDGGAACLELRAQDERPCDSHAWFEYVKGYGAEYWRHHMAGKVLAGLWLVVQNQCGDTADDDDESVEDTKVYVLLAQDGQQFPFALCHQSNGYYAATLASQWHFATKPFESGHDDDIQRIVRECPVAEVIVVVGLPASGKSTYARRNYGTALIYDDDELERADMLDEYFVHTALAHLRRDQKVCFVSARFCRAEHYAKFVAGFPARLRQHNRIATVLFDNAPALCQANNQRRSHEADARRTQMRIGADISRMASHYDPASALYLCPRHVPVYQTPV
jgi:hypothetical protein